MSGWVVTQANSDSSFTVPADTLVSVGSVFIVARATDRAGFEAFWGVTLGADVVFINSENTSPQINGDETYTLTDAGGTVLDGPTIALVSMNTYQRTSEAAANLDTSWATSGDQPGDTTPGSAEIAPATGGWITEFADASGTGNYIYEFVEVYVGAP